MGKIDDLLIASKGFEARQERAKQRLRHEEEGRWHFAVMGINTDIGNFDFDGLAEFREVIEPPGEVELAKALKVKTLFGAVGRYSHHIQYELSVRSDGEDSQVAFDISWWIFSLLRIKTRADFLVPLAADHSWSVIAGLNDGECGAQLLEDAPRAKRFDGDKWILEESFIWVKRYIKDFAELLEIPNFRLAVESYTTFAHEGHPRMAVASLWSGIEAILGVSQELKFRLSIYLAMFLKSTPMDSLATYRRIKKLYDFRSRVIHGDKVETEKLASHIEEVRSLLGDLLERCVLNKKVPSKKEWEEIIFIEKG